MSVPRTVSKAKKQPIVKTPPASKPAPPELHASQDKIRDRAFQIYQSRGSKPGLDTQDWLRAEIQIAESQIASR